MNDVVTFDDPASAALDWYRRLDEAGKARYDELVETAGVDVERLSGWAQLTLAWLAGENRRLSEAVLEILSAARRGAVERRDAALSQLAGQTTLDEQLAEVTPA